MARGLAARDLDELCGGRFVLGLGTGNVHSNDQYMGADSSRPMAKLPDYLAIVGSMLGARPGESINHEGTVHSIEWHPTFEPRRPGVPLLLSASGPTMVRLAGELTDGVVIGVMSSVEFVTESRRQNHLLLVAGGLLMLSACRAAG